LDAAFGVVLLLVVRLTLPTWDTESMEDSFNLLANFYLGPVTDELTWGSPFAYIVFQHVDKFPAIFDSIGIRDVGVTTYKNDGSGGTLIKCRGIGVDDITCNGFVVAVNIKCGVGRLEGALKESPGRQASILCSTLKCLRGGVNGEPAKHGAKSSIVICLVGQDYRLLVGHEVSDVIHI
jgi:hypothetical protein